MKDKVALVTGASSGIGREIALALARAGARVYGTSRSALPEEGGIRFIRLDVTSEASAREAIARVTEAESRLDILVNNAGSGISGPVEETGEGDALFQMEVNFSGAARMCRLALPHLRKSGGRILNVGSVAAGAAIPYQAFYSASKAALRSFTEALCVELAPFGVSCGILEPGDTRTGFTSVRQKAELAEGSVYRARCEKAVSRMEADELRGHPPEMAAKAAVKMLSARKMPARRTVGLSYKALTLLIKLLPLRVKLFAISKMY